MESKWTAVIASVAILAVAGVAVMSQGDTSEPTGIIPETGIEIGEEATLSFATFDATESSQTQVASTAYLWDESSEASVLLESDTEEDERTEFELETGDDYQIAVFDNTHPYGEFRGDETVESTSVNQNLDVYEAITTELDFEVRDNNEEVADVNLAPEEQETLDEVYAQVRDSEKSYNPSMILVEEGDDVDVTLPSMNEVDVPNSDELDNFDRAYEISDVSATGEPELQGFDEMSEGDILVQADDEIEDDSVEEVEFGVVDERAFIDNSNEFAEGVIDDDENLLGTQFTTTLEVAYE